jgi:hypothetical protein
MKLYVRNESVLLLMDHFAAKVGRIDLKIGKLELSLD